ncbi:MAG: hypothetical protein COU71_01070 [Parcubacteria group bacterium CG10_big_fil_rev_8_21_14_0_10_38_31]|nr:MAG: hypothetical protein COU71_01070 [Parcubacteria group bacterium CG10_big_fil_rev_8_21_14_0_10_38_31]
MAELLKFHKVINEEGSYLTEEEPDFLLLGEEDLGGLFFYKKHTGFYSLYALAMDKENFSKGQL